MSLVNDAKKKHITPWVFSESMYQLEGKPFRLTQGRNYLKPIYNADIKNTLLMTGRQVEKTTTESVKIANNVLLRNFSRSLYVAPMNEQVKTFSRGRMDKLFRYSQKDLVRKRYMDNSLSNQVFHKEFVNGSEIYMRNCYEEADNIRGLSIDDIFIDEVQDIIVEALPVIMETQARSKDPHLFLTGTPKTFSNTIQQQWDISSQADWVIRCPHCRKHQVLGVPNVTPYGFICRNPRCKKDLPDIARAMGRWEHQNPEADMKGFRITQMMVPDIDPASIHNKIMNYPKQRLYNEVLGRSYEQADKPFSDLLLNELTDDEEEPLQRTKGIKNPYANKATFMGIDWGEGEKNGQQGTGYTVIFIGAFDDDDIFRIIFTKRFENGDDLDPDYQLKVIMQLANAFDISMVAADYGAGQKENKRLRKQLKQRFVQVQYVAQQKKKMAFEAQDFKYKLPRSDWLTDFIEFAQQRQMRFAGKSNPDLEWIYKNFKSLYSEYRTNRQGTSEKLFYGHSISEPDDGFHACFYAWFATKVYTMKTKPKQSGGRGKGSVFRGTYGA